MALILAALTATGSLGPWGLLALTFAIGAGSAMNFPAWAATTNELVPREDLVGAIALNGIGFNLARALGPALGGFAIAAAGPQPAFALNARGLPGADRRAGLLAPAGRAAPAACRRSTWSRRHAGGAALRLGQPGDAGGDPPGLHLLPVHRRGLGPAAAVRAAATRAGAAGLRADAGRHGAVGGGGGLRPAGAARRGWTAAGRCSGPRCWPAPPWRSWRPRRALGARRRWACCSIGAAWIAAGSTLRRLGPAGGARLGAGAGDRRSTSSASSARWRWARRWPAGSAGASACRWRSASRRLGAVAAVAVRRWRIDSVALAARRPAEPPAAMPTPEAPAPSCAACCGEHSGRVLEVVRYRDRPGRARRLPRRHAGGAAGPAALRRGDLAAL